MNIAWPWVFVLLPLPWVLRWLAQRKQHTPISLPPRLTAVLDEQHDGGRTTQRLSSVVLWLSWLLLLLALSQPSRPGEALVQPTSGRAIALAVDLSGSMERKDFELDGEQSNRLSIVKRVVAHFIEQRRGDRLALVLFGEEAFVASPLSFDLSAVNAVLQNTAIGMAGRSTAIGDALGLAIQSLNNDPATEKAIVLLSDGTNNAGSVEPESAAQLARDRGIRVHTVALGSDTPRSNGFGVVSSADLDEDTLMAVAEQSGGQFFRATTTVELFDIYAAIDTLEGAESTSPPVIVQDDLRNPVIIALLLSLLLLDQLIRLQARRDAREHAGS